MCKQLKPGPYSSSSGMRTRLVQGLASFPGAEKGEGKKERLVSTVCVNSGHQVLFFPLLTAPGTRLVQGHACMSVHYKWFNPLSDCTLRSLEWKSTLSFTEYLYFYMQWGKHYALNLPHPLPMLQQHPHSSID